MKKYGWYSEFVAKKFGYCVYSDINGLLIKVTNVADNDGKLNSKVNDYVFVGEVIKCVKPNNDFFNRSTEELLNIATEMFAQQKKCQQQFASTKKCFCFTCKVNNEN